MYQFSKLYIQQTYNYLCNVMVTSKKNKDYLPERAFFSYLSSKSPEYSLDEPKL